MKSTISVTTPAASYNLTTLAYMISELQLVEPTQADQDLLTRHIEEVSAAIAKYCDGVFPTETVEQTIWWTRRDFRSARIGHSHFTQPFYYPITFGTKESLSLQRFPVATVERIVVDDEVVYDSYHDIGTAVDTVFRLDDETGEIFRLDAGGFLSVWSFSKKVVITYVGGYDTIPADLERAARIWIEGAWFAAGQDPLTLREEVIGIANIMYQRNLPSTAFNQDDVPEGVSVLLEPYKRGGLTFA